MEKMELKNDQITDEEFGFILNREVERVARRMPDKSFVDFENDLKISKLLYVEKKKEGSYTIKGDTRYKIISKLNIIFLVSVWGPFILLLYIIFEIL